MTGRQAAELIRRYGEPVSAVVDGEELVFDGVIRPAPSQDGQMGAAGFFEDSRFVLYAPPAAGRQLKPGDCLQGKTGAWMVRRVQPDSVRGEVVLVRVALSAVHGEDAPPSPDEGEPDPFVLETYGPLGFVGGGESSPEGMSDAEDAPGGGTPEGDADAARPIGRAPVKGEGKAGRGENEDHKADADAREIWDAELFDSWI